jgi:shikimate kinase
MSAEPGVPATRVLMMGMMASGKSTVGRALADLTGWPVLDNDVLLQRSTGSTAVALYEEHGLERLRSAESNVLTLILSMPAPLVAGVPAGVVLDPRDRERLRAGGHVVWVRTPVATLVRRVSKGSHRPFLSGDPAVALQAMADERYPLYEQVAHQVLDMQGLSASDAAKQVVTALQG